MMETPDMRKTVVDLMLVKRRVSRLEGFAEEADVIEDAISLLKAQARKWIPFVKRPLTEEEQKNHPDWCYILDGDVPEDEQEILLYRPWRNAEGYIIRTACISGNRKTRRYCNRREITYEVEP